MRRLRCFSFALCEQITRRPPAAVYYNEFLVELRPGADCKQVSRTHLFAFIRTSNAHTQVAAEMPCSYLNGGPTGLYVLPSHPSVVEYSQRIERVFG